MIHYFIVSLLFCNFAFVILKFETDIIHTACGCLDIDDIMSKYICAH